MIFEREPGETFTYYAGSGWSKADMKSQAEWNSYLTSFLNFHQHPITAQWTKKYDARPEDGTAPRSALHQTPQE